MPASIGLIIFASGAAPAHPMLKQMHTVRQACARDLLERAIEARSFDPIIVVTGDRTFAHSIGQLPVTIDLDDDESFHFGRRLAGVIDRYAMTCFLYMGAASAPLLTAADLAQIAEAARRHDRAVIANNINSTDWAAITPAAIVREWIDRLPSDNSLGWVLSHEAGLVPIGLAVDALRQVLLGRGAHGLLPLRLEVPLLAGVGVLFLVLARVALGHLETLAKREGRLTQRWQ